MALRGLAFDRHTCFRASAARPRALPAPRATIVQRATAARAVRPSIVPAPTTEPPSDTCEALRSLDPWESDDEQFVLEAALATGSHKGASCSDPRRDFHEGMSVDAATALASRDDAATYRLLVQPQQPLAGGSKPYNLKQMRSYRDNVTRCLAPTVSHGLAAACSGSSGRLPVAAHASLTVPSEAAMVYVLTHHAREYDEQQRRQKKMRDLRAAKQALQAAQQRLTQGWTEHAAAPSGAGAVLAEALSQLGGGPSTAGGAMPALSPA